MSNIKYIPCQPTQRMLDSLKVVKLMTPPAGHKYKWTRDENGSCGYEPVPLKSVNKEFLKTWARVALIFVVIYFILFPIVNRTLKKT